DPDDIDQASQLLKLVSMFCRPHTYSVTASFLSRETLLVVGKEGCVHLQVVLVAPATAAAAKAITAPDSIGRPAAIPPISPGPRSPNARPP
ncbi:MAG: hypothetical protein AAB227_11515, partial [Pseudomonadota bacterium]